MPKVSLTARLTVATTAIAAVVLVAAMTAVYVTARARVLEGARAQAQEQLTAAAAVIDSRLEAVETAVGGAEIAVMDNYRYHCADSLEGIVEGVVSHNKGIVGSAIALRPGECHDHEGQCMLYAVDARGAGIVSKDLDDPDVYDYVKMPWYAVPMASGKDGWSEPYYDRGGGDMAMCTYSHVLTSGDRRIGVLTADIDLDEIAYIIYDAGITGGIGGYCFLISDEGDVLFHPDESLMLTKTEVTAGEGELLFTAPVEGPAWVIGKVVSKDRLLQSMHRSVIYMSAMCVFTLVVLALALWWSIRRLSRPEVERQRRLDTELAVARRIQDGLLPSASSVTTPEVTVDAFIRPAKEVGGDFYNFHQTGTHLHFIIADVSGKGVPAAIFMAVATDLYTSLMNYDPEPRMTASHLNDMLCTANGAGMFCTALIGRLDTTDGTLLLCSAGHNAPLLDGSYLKLPPNIPLGVLPEFKYEQVELSIPDGGQLMLYTDGVTEAFNTAGEEFGAGRLKGCCADIHSVRQALAEFTRRCEQSDDITLLSVSYHPRVIEIAPQLEELPAVMEQVAAPLQLAVEEALVNVITHSGATAIKVIITDEAVTIVDDGTPFDPVSAPLPEAANALAPRVGGQGMRLMRSLATLAYRRTTSHNILTLYPITPLPG